MYEFVLNGKKISFEENMNLLEYLREEANLTSVKNGVEKVLVELVWF